MTIRSKRMTNITDLAREAGFNASVGKTDKDGKYKPFINALSKDVPIEWLERFATLHRTSIIESLTGEMPEPVFDRRWKLAIDGFGLQRDDANGNYVDIVDAVDVMREYAAGLVAKAVAEKQIQVDAGNRCIEILEAELAKRDAEIAELKQMLMRWLNDALSAEDVKKLERQTLEVLK